MNQKSKFSIVLSMLILILAIATSRMEFSRIQDPNALIILGLVLVINFIKEVRKSWRGETIAWDLLTPLDKLIFVICTIVLLIFLLYPIGEGMQIGTILISTLIGLSLTGLVANKFGSETLKEFLYFS